MIPGTSRIGEIIEREHLDRLLATFDGVGSEGTAEALSLVPALEDIPAHHGACVEIAGHFFQTECQHPMIGIELLRKAREALDIAHQDEGILLD